jgi:hypothetical membrane protein
VIQLPREPVLSRTLARWFAIAGISAPIVFTASAVTHSLTRDDHSLLSDPVSALAAGPSGWVQDATFAATGLLVVAFGFGLHLTLRPGRHLDPGPQLLALFGLGLVSVALWPAVDASGAFTENRPPHVVAGLVTFASAWLAALALAARLAGDPAWSSLARYARTVGVVLLLLFVTGSILVRPAGSALHDWLGLFQWIYLGVWFPCIAVLAGRLLRRSRLTQRVVRTNHDGGPTVGMRER